MILLRRKLMDNITTSKRLSYWLRHHPEMIGIELDSEGWTDLGILIQKANEHGFPFTLELITETARTSDKQRFAIKDGKIRANQGHSVDVDIQFTKAMPPDILYHGTALKVIDKILKEGLDKMKRHHVHLSDNKETARKVGQRHGKAVVLQVDANEMVKDGIEFYKSENNVWLVDSVHRRYLLEKMFIG